MKIDVYTQPMCQPCRLVKQMFEDAGLEEDVDYQVTDISRSDLGRQRVLGLGLTSVPVITAGSRVIQGVSNPDEIRDLIDEYLESDKDGRWLH